MLGIYQLSAYLTLFVCTLGDQFLEVIEELYTCLVRILTDFAIKNSNNTPFSQQLILYMFCHFLFAYVEPEHTI